jgi:energy-coupling factor transport system ATP-binding protein
MEPKDLSLLRFEGVSYRYPNVDSWTLRQLDLTIPEGQRVLLAGASGSGKSTLCRASIGLIPHFHRGELVGRVWVDGLDTQQQPVYRLFNHAGLVFQNPDAQLFNETVEAELAYGLESLGLTPAEIEERLTWASDLVGLGPLLSRPPHTLSGGEKQRVALGAILSLRPRLLLLDEPFTHLDPEGAEVLRGILRTVHTQGVSLVVVEHRLHEVIADFDRLIVLHGGEVILDGPPRQVLSHDVSRFGLTLPPLVRLFRDSNWKDVPLTVEEAVQWLKGQGLSQEVNHSTPRPEGRGLPFDRLKAPSTAEGLEVHPERRLQPGLERRGFAPSKRVKIRKGEAGGFENGQPVVAMDDVWYHYDGSPALRGIRLTMGLGESIAIVGRNGAGKTTLVKHLNGLLKPAQGTVSVVGQNTLRTTVAELARHVGFAWQNSNDQLFQPHVRQEVLTGPRALGAYDPAWCNELFERFHLEALLDRSPFQLSEGQKKRVSFAAALAAKPKIVVLDEPTAGQDESFRRELGKLIRELQAEGRTVVLVTHDLEFAAEHANRWIALNEGEVVADGTPEEVMNDRVAMRKAGLRPTQRFQLMEAIGQERTIGQRV